MNGLNQVKTDYISFFKDLPIKNYDRNSVETYQSSHKFKATVKKAQIA